MRRLDAAFAVQITEMMPLVAAASYYRASSYSNRATVDLQELRIGDILGNSANEIFDLLLALPSFSGYPRRRVSLFPAHYSLLAVHASCNKAPKGI